MKYYLTCRVCAASWSVRGSYEWDTNAVDLKMDDPGWDEACDHADYVIEDSDYDDD